MAHNQAFLAILSWKITHFSIAEQHTNQVSEYQQHAVSGCKLSQISYVKMHHFWAFHRQNVWVWYGACFHRQASERTCVHLSCVQICSLPMPVCDKKVSVPGCNLFMCEICIYHYACWADMYGIQWLRYNDQCTNLLIKTQTYYWFPYKCAIVFTQLTMIQGWKLVWNYAAVAMNILHWLFKSSQTTAKTHWISPWKPTQTIS